MSNIIKSQQLHDSSDGGSAWNPEPLLSSESVISEEDHQKNLLLIQKIPINITIELGRKTLLAKDVLGLHSGSVVVLEKNTGSFVDIFANGVQIGKGEITVVKQQIGVRIVEFTDDVSSEIRKANTATISK